MPIHKHKFHAHQVHPQTRILIIGTFEADQTHAGDFFYGRQRSFLWHLLPICYGLPSLKEASLTQKQQFIQRYHIDFADVIESLEIEEDEDLLMEDEFIDQHIHAYKDVIGLINTLPQLEAVYFTRKTFNGIPNTKKGVSAIADYCKEKGIRFCKLDTPARHFSDEKQQQWKDTIVLRKTCLRV